MAEHARATRRRAPRPARGRRWRRRALPAAALALLAVALALLAALAPPGRDAPPAAAQAAAQAPVIQVNRNSAGAELPDEVRFRLQATSVGARMTRVQLEYGTGALVCGGPVATTASPEFSPGYNADVEYAWDLRASALLPPGAQVWWRWHIRDEQGGELVTERETLLVGDARFAWREREAGVLRLHWYTGSERFADDLLASGGEALERLAGDTGVVVTSTVNIYVYPDPETMSAVLLNMPIWAGGVAFPEHNSVLIGIAPWDLEWGLDAIRHELAHVVIGHLTLNCLVALPTWLSEGLAVYAEGELDAESAALLARAIRDNRLDSVRALSGPFSAHPERATMAYVESYSLVAFLIERDGQARMLALLEAFGAGQPADAALRAIYGFDSDGLEDRWRAAIGARPRAGANATPTGAATRVPTLPPIGDAPLSPSATPCPPAAACPSPIVPATAIAALSPTAAASAAPDRPTRPAATPAPATVTPAAPDARGPSEPSGPGSWVLLAGLCLAGGTFVVAGAWSLARRGAAG